LDGQIQADVGDALLVPLAEGGALVLERPEAAVDPGEDHRVASLQGIAQPLAVLPPGQGDLVRGLVAVNEQVRQLQALLAAVGGDPFLLCLQGVVLLVGRYPGVPVDHGLFPQNRRNRTIDPPIRNSIVSPMPNNMMTLQDLEADVLQLTRQQHEYSSRQYV
jgi:hypothetical protein